MITLDQFRESMNEKIDNTGNVRDWPSEDILAYYSIQKGLISNAIKAHDSDKNKLRVIELGAGKTGLVGFAFSAIANDQGFENLEVIVSDGNTKCVEQLNQTIELNPSIKPSTLAKHLIWSKDNDPQPEYGIFRHIFISDCLYFTDFHDDLIYTLQRLSDLETEVWIAAPERGASMQ